MPPDQGLRGICPICSHMADTGDHRLEMVPGYDLPFMICPSFDEFILDARVIVFDQGEPAKRPEQTP